MKINVNQREADLFTYWRKRVFMSVWITYGTFYLTRVNMSIAIPGIMKEFGYSKTTLGIILTCFFTTYAIGQFFNGQMGDKFGARRFIALGLLMSGILNIIFGFTTTITMFMLIWGLNGYFQSMGWPASVKTIANWFPPKKRGKMSGLLGTSYQVGNAYSWVLAGLMIGFFHWKWAFWVPGTIVIVSAIYWYIRGRNAPEEVSLPMIEEEGRGMKINNEIRKDHHVGFLNTLAIVLKNPKIWVVAFGLFCLNIIRYGFIDWLPTYMFEVQKTTISSAAYKAIAMPLAGSLGAVVSGWISDRFFGSRRAPISVIMLFILGLSALLYPKIPAGNWGLSLICILLIGFMTYGPHVLMVGAIAMDFGTRKASASAAGFIDCFGYIGAALAGVGSAHLIEYHGWNTAFYFWVAGAFGATILMATLWNYKETKKEYY